MSHHHADGYKSVYLQRHVGRHDRPHAERVGVTTLGGATGIGLLTSNSGGTTSLTNNNATAVSVTEATTVMGFVNTGAGGQTYASVRWRAMYLTGGTLTLHGVGTGGGGFNLGLHGSGVTTCWANLILSAFLRSTLVGPRPFSLDRLRPEASVIRM